MIFQSIKRGGPVPFQHDGAHVHEKKMVIPNLVRLGQNSDLNPTQHLLDEPERCQAVSESVTDLFIMLLRLNGSKSLRPG